MKTWNISVVGAGLIADFHARAINDIPNAKLFGFCDSGSGRAKKLAEKYSCRHFENYLQMVESNDIDIITVATPSGFHAEPTIAAAKQGKHVICEKPLDVTLERIDSMIQAHAEAGTKLCGIFPCRFNESLVPLKQAIDSGRFGVITYAGVYVPWWRTDEYYKDSWHGTWKLDGGGALMNQSIHMVDMLCYLMPPIEAIQAFTATLGHPQIEAEDTAVAAIKFANGALGTIYGTTASFPGQFRRFEITGTKGTVVYVEDSITVWQFADEKPQDEQVRQKFGQVGSKGGVADPAAIAHQNHTRNFKQFIDALDNSNDNFIDGKEARKAVELILAIYKSAKEQKLIRLE